MPPIQLHGVTVMKIVYKTVDLVIFACLNFREFLISRLYANFRIREFLISLVALL